MHQSHKHVDPKKPDQNKIICLFHLNLLLCNKLPENVVSQNNVLLFFMIVWDSCGFSDVIWIWLQIWWGWRVRGDLIPVSGGAWFSSTWPRPPSWRIWEQHPERVKVKLPGLRSRSRTSCSAFVFLSVTPSQRPVQVRGVRNRSYPLGDDLTLRGSATRGWENLWPHFHLLQYSLIPLL